MPSSDRFRPQGDAQDAARFLAQAGGRPGDELPSRYGSERITLMVRDPHGLFAYWECSSDRATLRVYRTGPGGRFLDPVFEEVVPGVGSRYVRVPYAGGAYAALLLAAGGAEHWSNGVTTPPGRVSDVEDVAWATIRELLWSTEPADASSPGRGRTLGRLVLEEHGGSHAARRRPLPALGAPERRDGGRWARKGTSR